MPPVYEFKCKQCGTIYEFNDREVEVECCDEVLIRNYSIAGIKFKGTGFYSTDSRLD